MRMTAVIRDRNAVRLAQPLWVTGMLWIGLPVSGIGLGWLGQAIAGWVAGLPAAPFQGPFKVVAAIPQPYALIGALVVGGLAGLVLAFLVHLDSLTVTITADEICLVRDEDVQEFPRSSIRALFLDQKELILLGRDGTELGREKHDIDPGRLAAAFRAYGFPWHDNDPYDVSYRRWVNDTPGIPAAANALLKARGRALAKGDSDDMKQLREELARLNVVVRDRDKRQFWRRTDTSSS
jgi:hypothetical protein